MLHVCRRAADSEASDGKQTENIPKGEETKTASLIQRLLQQAAAVVATFKVDPVFLEDNAAETALQKTLHCIQNQVCKLSLEETCA